MRSNSLQIWHCYLLLLCIVILSFGLFRVADANYVKASTKDEYRGIQPSGRKMQLFDDLAAFAIYSSGIALVSFVIFTILHFLGLF